MGARSDGALSHKDYLELLVTSKNILSRFTGFSHLWFRPTTAEAPLSSTTYISYFDVINEAKAKAFMAACADAVAQTRPSRLYFLFSSSGGSVDAGIALYNYLRALPVPIVMHNTGSIDSIANVVFLAADERYANPHSIFLLHASIGASPRVLSYPGPSFKRRWVVSRPMRREWLGSSRSGPASSLKNSPPSSIKEKRKI